MNLFVLLNGVNEREQTYHYEGFNGIKDGHFGPVVGEYYT